ncbi:DUF5691 domain-containing protein [Deinococcus maricopensis]|uniref:Uncharacterized protein n=1 Tax=Deinococcus maricopensis (strain DSM 21211 / LMG 22137 / NRRL B-23946 / LB-34) TaxID=709986 RepID=E8U5K0_DEIML|nr:DUF5691 domain-containing protein [Deinococcus maricopensis]ADV66339.1 hypothetical protein Deima_0682 [Deinococcus maricopensis DSM 21211]
MTDAWTALRQAAALGTARAPLPPRTPNEPALPARNDAALALLDRAAVLGAARLAGRTTRPAPQEPTAPAPPEPTPPVSDRAAALLGTVLAQRPMLLAWLGACTAAGQHLPARWLPDVLDLTASDPDVRRAVRPVLGARGTWLARQNPQWRFALPAALPDEDTWTNATPAVREELFRAAREADPDAARTFLAARFPQERGEMQERLLRVLLGTLDDADATLEATLDAARAGRNKNAQALAAQLLRRLPGTAYQARMEARLRALVRLPPEATGLAKLNPLRDTKPTLNDYVPDADAHRDDLPAGPLKAHDALRALLPLMHPQAVLNVLGPDAALAVRRAVQLNALKALEEAHANAPGGDLAQALTKTRRHQAADDLIAHLPPADLEAHVLAWLEGTPNWHDGHHSGLHHLPAPWNARVSAAAVAALARTAPRDAPSPQQRPDYSFRWRWASAVGDAAVNASVHTPLPDLPDLPDNVTDDARQQWNDLTHTLLLRREILAAFDLKEPA